MRRLPDTAIPARIVRLFAMELDRRIVRPGEVSCTRLPSRERTAPIIFRLGGRIHDGFTHRRLEKYYRFKAARGFGANFRRWE